MDSGVADCFRRYVNARDEGGVRREFRSSVPGAASQIERAARALLENYRQANQGARSQPAPSYFSQPYNLERIIYAGNEPNEAFREQLSRSIDETQKLLAGQIQAVHDVFNEAVRSYREIDDLIPGT